MFKRIFYWGISAGIASAVAALIYNRVYFFITEANFSKVVNLPSLIGANLLACMLAALLYWVCKRSLPKKGELVFNFALAMLSFASIILPIAVHLPLDIQFPELFPGLTIPMHFSPPWPGTLYGPFLLKSQLKPGENRSESRKTGDRG